MIGKVKFFSSGSDRRRNHLSQRHIPVGDQLILQGQLKITKVTHKIGEEEYVEQQASLIVEKINRIQRAS